MNLRETATLLAVLICSASLAGCGGDASAGAGVPKAWYDALDTNYATAERTGSFGQDARFSIDDGCDIADAVQINGQDTSRQYGAEVRRLTPKGRSFGCSFTDPFVRLVVARFAYKSGYEQADDFVHAQTEGRRRQSEKSVTVGNRRFVVVRTAYPDRTSVVDYTAEFRDPKHRGVVLLLVTTTAERGLIDDYSSDQAAKDLAGLLDRG